MVQFSAVEIDAHQIDGRRFAQLQGQHGVDPLAIFRDVEAQCYRRGGGPGIEADRQRRVVVELDALRVARGHIVAFGLLTQNVRVCDLCQNLPLFRAYGPWIPGEIQGVCPAAPVCGGRRSVVFGRRILFSIRSEHRPQGWIYLASTGLGEFGHPCEREVWIDRHVGVDVWDHEIEQTLFKPGHHVESGVVVRFQRRKQPCADIDAPAALRG